MRTFYEWLALNESMNIYVKDHDFQNDIKDLSDLCYYLINKVVNPLWSKLSNDQKNQIAATGSHNHGIIAPDGSYYSNGDEIINVYTGGWPDVNKLLQGIKYYLNEKHVKYTMSGEEKSGMFDSPVIRIHVKNWKPTEDMPPQLNLSNDNAHIIFGDLLGLRGDNNGYFDINVRDLYMKIEELEKHQIDTHEREPYSTQKPGKAKIMHGGLSSNQIEERLEKIKQICLWAMNKGYDYLYVA